MTHVGKETTLGAVRFLCPILGLTQRILGMLPLDHPPELSANIGHHLQQRFIGLNSLTREVLERGGLLTQIGYVPVDDDSPVVRCLAFPDLYPAVVALQLKALTGMRPV